MKYVETWNVLQPVWMVYPNQASSPQGPHGVSCEPLVVNVLGIGPGWKQSRQNRSAQLCGKDGTPCRGIDKVGLVDGVPSRGARKFALTVGQRKGTPSEISPGSSDA